MSDHDLVCWYRGGHRGGATTSTEGNPSREEYPVGPQSRARTSAQPWLFHDLNYVLVLQHVAEPDMLRVVLDRGAPNLGEAELFSESFMDLSAEV